MHRFVGISLASHVATVRPVIAQYTFTQRSAALRRQLIGNVIERLEFFATNEVLDGVVNVAKGTIVWSSGDVCTHSKDSPSILVQQYCRTPLTALPGG